MSDPVYCEECHERDDRCVCHVECLYCEREVESTHIPALEDEAGWKEIASEHHPKCEWVLTRAHRIWPPLSEKPEGGK